jgi:molecular chaperone GrpE
MSSSSERSETPTTPKDPEGPELGAGGAAESTAPNLEAELKAARADAAAAQDRYLRAVADLENFRRRSVRERDEVRGAAAANVLQDVIPVWDNLLLGIAAARQPKADLKTLIGGVDMVLQQLKAGLAAHGLAEFSPVGERFDPHRHEAISHEASPTVPAEQILSVVRSGFTLHGRLLRPASVVVSSGPEASPQA